MRGVHAAMFSTPTTHTEKRVAQHIIKRLMAEGQDSTLLQVPTRGQVSNTNDLKDL